MENELGTKRADFRIIIMSVLMLIGGIFLALQISKVSMIQLLSLESLLSYSSPIGRNLGEVDVVANFVAAIFGGIFFYWFTRLLWVTKVFDPISATRLMDLPIQYLLDRVFGLATSKEADLTSPDAVLERPSAIPAYRVVVENLDQSVRNLRHRASVIYWTIISLIIGGVVLVIFSGYLSRDS